MQHPWLFYFLFFVLGYVTCRAFYFLSASKKSLGLLKVTQVVSLFIIVRALEHFNYAKDYRLSIMKENDASEQNIRAFLYRFDDEVKYYKTKTIRQIIEAHGSFFNQIVDFTDWKSAMTFLEANRELVEEFIAKE